MATLWTQTFDFKNKAGMLCMGHDDDTDNRLSKGWPAYINRGAEKFETNSLQSMTLLHSCWFIADIWKSDHHLNIFMTLGTDIKYTLSFLSIYIYIDLLNHCGDESEFCLISRL